MLHSTALADSGRNGLDMRDELSLSLRRRVKENQRQQQRAKKRTSVRANEGQVERQPGRQPLSTQARGLFAAICAQLNLLEAVNGSMGGPLDGRALDGQSPWMDDPGRAV